MPPRDRHLFTSESVTEGHPDKIADQISDAVLDAMIAQDPRARVACETMVTTGLVVVAGEITTECYVDIPLLVRKTIEGVGYTRAKFGFDHETCGVICSLDKQSPDIAMGVDTGGAGDQGLMFGFACRDTSQLMPMPIQLAHNLTRQLSRCRKDGVLNWLRPDGKSQVTVEYDGFVPLRVDAVVISTQHSDAVSNDQIHEGIRGEVITPVVPADLMDDETKIYVNPTGRFVRGGPQGDCGLDRTQDYRRHLRWHGASRRRGVFRKRPLQGGSIGQLHGPLHCQESGGGRAGGPHRDPARLRDRRGRARVCDAG